MSHRDFKQLLARAAADHDSLVCVGLDPEPEKFPPHLRGVAHSIFEFNKAIVDATADLVCSYKPQFAHYAALGAEDQLLQTIRYINARAPGVPVILDSKRGDIGNTAGKYAQEAFERYGADAVTVNPYLGGDSLQPFLDWKDKGIVILCRTSNPGARDFQDLEVGGGRKLYHAVAERAAKEWNRHGNCLLVVGATYPAELAEVRAHLDWEAAWSGFPMRPCPLMSEPASSKRVTSSRFPAKAAAASSSPMLGFSIAALISFRSCRIAFLITPLKKTIGSAFSFAARLWGCVSWIPVSLTAPSLPETRLVVMNTKPSCSARVM